VEGQTIYEMASRIPSRIISWQNSMSRQGLLIGDEPLP
jgi:hypothetical protein